MSNNGPVRLFTNGVSKTNWGVFCAACTLVLALAVLAFTAQNRITDLKIEKSKVESQLETEKVKNAILQLRVEEKKYAY